MGDGLIAEHEHPGAVPEDSGQPVKQVAVRERHGGQRDVSPNGPAPVAQRSDGLRSRDLFDIWLPGERADQHRAQERRRVRCHDPHQPVPIPPGRT
jgi:hypothetical protein